MCSYVKYILVGAGFLALAGAPARQAEAVTAKIALIHNSPLQDNVAGNIANYEDLIEEAFLAGAKFVVTPERATTGYVVDFEEIMEGGQGTVYPYPELDGIRQLAIDYQGYVVITVADITEEEHIHQVAVLFGPEGLIHTVQKRVDFDPFGRGHEPIQVASTPYGDVSTWICADSYRPDYARIAALKGADILLLPANWWGYQDQEQNWATRARENGIWVLVANRRGIEESPFDPSGFNYYEDAPSAVVSPDGEIRMLHRAEDDPVPVDKILYYTIDVPAYRIGTDFNPTYSISQRRPEAYGELGNEYYRPDSGLQMVPGLPPDGPTKIGTITYQPNLLFPQSNLNKLKSIWNAGNTSADLLVLPALGISIFPIDSSNPNWHQAFPWNKLQDFVEEKGLLLLATTVLDYNAPSGLTESVLVLQPDEAPLLAPQIHDSLLIEGSGEEPLFVDLPHSRIGFLSGRDALFPEAVTHLARVGMDTLVIPSRVGLEGPIDPLGYFLTPAALQRLWQDRVNHVNNVVASDWTGHGLVLEAWGAGIVRQHETTTADPMAVYEVITDSTPYPFGYMSTRVKFLGELYPFDLEVLLGPSP